MCYFSFEFTPWLSLNAYHYYSFMIMVTSAVTFINDCSSICLMASIDWTSQLYCWRKTNTSSVKITEAAILCIFSGNKHHYGDLFPNRKEENCSVMYTCTVEDVQWNIRRVYMNSNNKLQFVRTGPSHFSTAHSTRTQLSLKLLAFTWYRLRIYVLDTCFKKHCTWVQNRGLSTTCMCAHFDPLSIFATTLKYHLNGGSIIGHNGVLSNMLFDTHLYTGPVSMYINKFHYSCRYWVPFKQKIDGTRTLDGDEGGMRARR